MADCDPPPTATLLQTVTQTQDQVVTSFSVVSDLSGTISLETLTSCAGLSTGTGGGCAKPTTVVHTATVDQIATRQVPFTQTFHNTVTITQPTKTLFGQCRQTHSTLSTPSPTIIDVPTTTTNDQGDTYVATVKTTSTPPPTLVADSTITTGPTDTAAANGVGSGGGGGSGGGSNIAAIAGGVVGGVVLLGLIGGLVWLWWRRRKRWDDIFDDNDEVLKNGRPGAMTQLKSDGGQADFGNPTPYQYGIVGSQAPERHVTHASYSGISPGHSPQPSQGSNLGPADPRYTMALPPLHQPQVYPPVSPPPTIGSQHSRNNSTRPPSSYSSRPSSPAHSRRRSRGPDEVIGLVALGPREMSPPQTPTALPNITPMVPTPMTTSTTGATTTQVIGGRVVMSATPQIQTTTGIVHTDGGRVEPISPQVLSSSSTAGATTTQLITRPNEKRPRVVMSAAPVVVHTDGGRVDPASPPAGAGPSIPERENSTGDDAPPAYS